MDESIILRVETFEILFLSVLIWHEEINKNYLKGSFSIPVLYTVLTSTCFGVGDLCAVSS